MPSNVKVTICSSPIRSVYSLLGDADKKLSSDVFYLYSDRKDIEERFPKQNLLKYIPHLYKSSQLVFVPVERVGEFNISGTKMRKYVEDGDKNSFITSLPDDVDGNAIWNILHKI